MGTVCSSRTGSQRTYAKRSSNNDASRVSVNELIQVPSPLIPPHSRIIKKLQLIVHYFIRYGFVEFLTEEDADYSIKIMNMIKLYGKPIRVNKASAHQKNLDVGANIFIGNLDPEVDEKLLYDTFSAFGVILTTPKVYMTALVNIQGLSSSYS